MNRLHTLSRAALVLVLAGGVRAPAQTTQAASQPTSVYVDPAFGFELRLPVGWEYDRTRFQQFKDSIGLLRGRGPEGRRGLQIIVFRSFPMKPFEDWVVDFGKASAELLSSPRTDWETWKLPPRAGAVLTYTSKLGLGLTRTHVLCLPFDPNTIWVLIYSGQAFGQPDETAIRGEFEQVAGSLHVQYDPGAAARLAPAFERGQALVERLRADPQQTPLDESEYLYDMAVAGKPVGYLQRRTSREEHVYSGATARRQFAKEGLRVRERAWRFLEDGTVWYTRLDAFSSFDGQSELIESVQTQVPPPGAQPQELFTKTDQVIREADTLVSSYTTSADRALPEPGKPISVGPAYLDYAWVRVLPTLLAAAPPEPHAVAVYSGEIRALLSHVVQPLGPQKLPGYDSEALAYEVREGFVDRPSTLFCDRKGVLLRMDAGEVTLTRAPRAEIERKYGRRRDEARNRFQLPTE